MTFAESNYLMDNDCYHWKNFSYRLICQNDNKLRYIQYKSSTNCHYTTQQLSVILNHDNLHLFLHQMPYIIDCQDNHNINIKRRLLSSINTTNTMSTTHKPTPPKSNNPQNITGYVIIGILAFIIFIFWIAIIYIKCCARREYDKSRKKKKRRKNRNEQHSHCQSLLLEDVCDDDETEDKDRLNSLPRDNDRDYKRMTIDSMTHITEEQSNLSSQLKWKSTYTPTGKTSMISKQSWIKYIATNKKYGQSLTRMSESIINESNDNNDNNNINYNNNDVDVVIVTE